MTEHTYWSKQGSEPLFPDILWSRPETKFASGKLTLIGGNSHAFSAPALAFSVAEQAGAGIMSVLLPDAVRKVVHGFLPEAEFAPSTPSGSFSTKALDQCLQLARWADGTLLAGDFGRNSETAILLEKFVHSYSGILTITQDTVDYFKETPLHIIDRPNTLVVLSLSQLQKVFINTPTITPILLSMGSLQLAEALHAYTLEHPACIITKHNDLLFVARSGHVSTTKYDDKIWRVAIAAKASVFALQNPDKLFEAATSALFDQKPQN